MDSAHIPFSFPDVYQGLATGSGIATATPAGLTLEFQVQDGFFGVIKSGIKKVDIPLGELYSVAFEEGWFRNRLLIKVRRMTTLADVPGSSTDKVELRVARRDKVMAQTLASLLMLNLSQKQLAELGRNGLEA